MDLTLNRYKMCNSVENLKVLHVFIQPRGYSSF